MKRFVESLAEEYRKIRKIKTVRKRIYHVLDYFGLWIAGIAVVCAALIYLTHAAFVAKKETAFYITFANTFADVGDKSALWDNFVSFAGYDTKEEKVVFNNNAFFDYAQGVTGNSYFEAFVAHTETGDLDALTMEKDALTALGESGRLLDLNAPECAAIREKYGDRFLYCRPYDDEYAKQYEDGMVAVGIDVSDSILVSEYGVYTDSCAIGLGAGSERIAATEQFLDFILQ